MLIKIVKLKLAIFWIEKRLAKIRAENRRIFKNHRFYRGTSKLIKEVSLLLMMALGGGLFFKIFGNAKKIIFSIISFKLEKLASRFLISFIKKVDKRS